MSKGTLNKVILIGRVGVDPEIRYMPSGNAVANLRIATNESYKDKNTGEWQEATEWHRVVMYNKLAELVGQYVQKGRLIYVEGRIRTNKWQDQSGQDRYTTEIIANEMQLLGGSGRGEEGGLGGSSSHSQQASASHSAPKTGSAGEAQSPPDMDKFEDDDIPF